MTRMGQDPVAGHRIQGHSEPSLLDETELREDVDDLGSLDSMLAESDQGWDIEAQVLTLKQAAASTHVVPAPETSPGTRRVAGQAKGASRPPPPLTRRGPPPLPPGPRTPELAAARLPSELAQAGAIVDLLNARVATLRAGDSTPALTRSAGDAIGLARTYMELALASEMILGDDEAAAQNAEAALKVDPTFASAHAMLRRTKHSRAALPAMLGHLERELYAATSEPNKIELLAEKARLLEAVGDGSGTSSANVRATWEQALAHAPHHAAALKGLEAVLVARALSSNGPPEWEALATHLGKMAAAYGSEAELAAWLHVERAQILERKLGRVDAARGALEQALSLDPKVGPVRSALVRHAAAHSDWGTLARLLDEEAGIESSPPRTARLELDAALIAATRLGDRTLARSLLERAAARAPTTPSVDRRVLDELVRD